ncbi:MAG: epimerase [Bryobacteraceae bacterium]
MKVILFGASGMVGQGVLRECLIDRDVESVLSIGRSATGQKHPKLRELIHKDFLDFSAIEGELAGYDACFFCLGVSSAGMPEKDYRRITYGFTMAAAEVLARLNPQMTFIYVSAQGAGSKGPFMWSRVRGETEKALLALPFRAAYMFRPGAIVPLHGIQSKTKLYRLIYAVTGPVLPVLKAWMPSLVTSTEQLGQAMLQVAKEGASTPILESSHINKLWGA